MKQWAADLEGHSKLFILIFVKFKKKKFKGFLQRILQEIMKKNKIEGTPILKLAIVQKL